MMNPEDTFRDPAGEPNAESLASVRETEEIISAGGTGESFDTGRELLEAARKSRLYEALPISEMQLRNDETVPVDDAPIDLLVRVACVSHKRESDSEESDGRAFSADPQATFPVRDSMTDDEFDALLEIGYRQALAGEGLPIERLIADSTDDTHPIG